MVRADHLVEGLSPRAVFEGVLQEADVVGVVPRDARSRRRAVHVAVVSAGRVVVHREANARVRRGELAAGVYALQHGDEVTLECLEPTEEVHRGVLLLRERLLPLRLGVVAAAPPLWHGGVAKDVVPKGAVPPRAGFFALRFARALLLARCQLALQPVPPVRHGAVPRVAHEGERKELLRSEGLAAVHKAPVRVAERAPLRFARRDAENIFNVVQDRAAAALCNVHKHKAVLLARVAP